MSVRNNSLLVRCVCKHHKACSWHLISWSPCKKICKHNFQSLVTHYSQCVLGNFISLDKRVAESEPDAQS